LKSIHKNKVLLIGGAGYVGSRLAPFLSEKHNEVEILDTFWFGNYLPKNISFKKLDASQIDQEYLSNFKCVIFLAGISNDPMADFSPRLNFIHNLSTPVHVALLCKRAGVKRFIFASSCSVYGYNPNKTLTELDKAITNTPYGLSKLACETALLNLCSSQFSVICLRKGTISGYSPRLRFDLLLNTMFKNALVDNKVIVNDPNTKRPLLGISDALNAYLLALNADLAISGIFNISSDNFTTGDLAIETQVFFSRVMRVETTIETKKIRDLRSYSVSIDKARLFLKFIPEENPFSILDDLRIGSRNLINLEDDSFYNIKVFRKLGLE